MIPPIKPKVSFEQFSKLDLRVATVLESERIPKTDKLIKVLISDGESKRTVISGIAPHYEPKDLIGKKVILLANLEPRRMRNIESNGMLLLAENSDSKPIFISPKGKDAKDGQPIG